MIPSKFQFIYFYGKDTVEFNIHHMISISSNIRVNNATATLYTNDLDRLDGNKYIQILKQAYPNCFSTSLVPLEFYPSTDSKLHNTPYMAHLTDYIRIRLMNYYGGIYSDVDSIAINPIPKWLLDESDQIITCWEYPGESSKSLCNGFWMSPVNMFINKRWHETMEDYYDPMINLPGTPQWTQFSVQYFYRLYELFPNQFKVFPSYVFEPFTLTYDDTLRLFFTNNLGQLRDSYQLHLWETRNHPILKLLTLEYFEQSDATYAQVGLKEIMHLKKTGEYDW